METTSTQVKCSKCGCEGVINRKYEIGKCPKCNEDKLKAVTRDEK